jgi:hypothetical protein
MPGPARPALVALAACLVLAACATSPAGPAGWRGIDEAPPPRATLDPSVIALRAKLAEGARSIIGKKQLLVRGRRFTMDCTGVVLAIYWYAGIDLAKDFNRYTGGGVERIWRTLEHDGLLYSTSNPLVGDVIFWDNTYDHDGDGTWNDPLSHAGMVTGVDDDGTIAYIHYHERKGISTDYMNLRMPGVQSVSRAGHLKIVNSPMRLAVAGQPHPPNWLSGQLYRALGLAYLLQ